MKIFSVLGLMFIVAASQELRAADDTAHHRVVYADINGKLDSYKQVKASVPDEDFTVELRGWSDGTGLRKIVAKVPGEDGDGFEEFYLEDGEPLFVYRTYTTENGKTKVEDRFYFNEGEMFKWIGTDKKAVSVDSEDFEAEADRLASNCTSFVGALEAKGSGEKAKKGQTTEGTFVEIEEGDYTYWKMRNKGGDEVSFFILHPDAAVEKVLDNPKAYAGRKCRVEWKESTENIPEAGGKIKIEQILSVEWLDKK